MGDEAIEILKKALHLPAAERAELAGSLIESLDESHDESVQAAWDAEIVRRMEDFDTGRVIDVRQVIDHFVDKLADVHPFQADACFAVAGIFEDLEKESPKLIRLVFDPGEILQRFLILAIDGGEVCQTFN